MIRYILIVSLLALLQQAYSTLDQCRAAKPKPATFQPLRKTT